MREMTRADLGLASEQWAADCLKWRGSILAGVHGHWCPEWDDLPIDETCREWPCQCQIGMAARETPEQKHERELAALIVAYYRREIGEKMRQAAHWRTHGAPLAVHHRVMGADSFFQIVALFEREKGGFREMRETLARPPFAPGGKYPAPIEVARYRDAKFAAMRYAETQELAQRCGKGVKCCIVDRGAEPCEALQAITATDAAVKA